jgi:hypothetical protein
MKNLANHFPCRAGFGSGSRTDGISHEKLTFRAVQVSSTRYFYFQYIYDARLLFYLYSILVKCD